MTEAPNATAPPTSLPKRRRNLRIGMGILLAIGMICGWAAMGRQKARKQAEAIRAITAVGGDVYLDYQWQDGHFQSAGQPQQAAWLRQLFGPGMFDHAVAVDLRRVSQLDEAVRWLPMLPYIADINASSTHLDDAALTTLCRLAGVTRLDLSGTTVTDDGGRQLARLTQLKTLSLAATSVTDQCVSSLADLKRLRQLDLTATQVSDKGAGQLQRALPKCRVLRQ